MKRIALFLTCLCLLAPILTGTSITYVGIETGSVVQNWSNPTVVKTHDLNGDNRFGGAGYYQITPGQIGDANWSDSASPGNDMGVSALYPTQRSKPAFIGSDPAGGSGNYVNFSFYPQFFTSDGSTQMRQGSLAVTIPDENEGTVPGNVFGKWCNAFTLTLNQSAAFRLGVAVDNVANADNAPDYVSIFNTSTGEVFSSPLTRDGSSDMVFFNIEGSADDVFSVRLWQSTGETGGPITFALVTFDQASIPHLSCTQNGDNVTLSWEQNIAGWILESSTDLGVGDNWDPVPDVGNDNSVTVSMSGVPKNFFRLKKNP